MVEKFVPPKPFGLGVGMRLDQMRRGLRFGLGLAEENSDGSRGSSRTGPFTAVCSGAWRKSEQQLELLSPSTTASGWSRKNIFSAR